MAQKKHKDVEYYVEEASEYRAPELRKSFQFDTAAEASLQAVVMSMSNGQPVNIDVVIHSKAGAKFYGGDDAVEQFEEDPEASVFERIVVRAESQGRIP